VINAVDPEIPQFAATLPGWRQIDAIIVDDLIDCSMSLKACHLRHDARLAAAVGATIFSRISDQGDRLSRNTGRMDAA
jgi:hypothetical protein